MEKIITICSGRSGTGKTTCALGIGGFFSNIKKKVLIIEFSLSNTGLDICLASQNKVVFNIGDIFLNNCNINQAIITSDQDENISFISGANNIYKDIDHTKYKFFLESVKSLDKFDYIIIDFSLQDIEILSYILDISNLNLFITSCDSISIRENSRLISHLKEIKEIKARLIINKVEKRILKLEQIFDLDFIIDTICLQLIGVLSYRKNISITAINKQILDKDKLALKIFDNIGRRILGDDIPLKII